MPDNLRDWAAIVFGLAGLAISVYNLLRARMAEKKATIVGLQQKKMEAIQAANEAIQSRSRRRRMLRDLQIDAAAAGKSSLLPELKELIETEDESVRSVAAIAAELQDLNLDAVKDHAKWYQHFHTVVVSFGGKYTASDEEATEEYVHEARMNLKLSKDPD